jgi:predicted GIY-YIG superfamily endonuclease
MEKRMDESFKALVESLHPAFQQLISMEPISIEKLPKGLPSQCIYLFSEDGKPPYVGRTKQFPNRLRQHSSDWAQHNQAVFAFKLAREITGNLHAAYTSEGSRIALLRDVQFAAAFAESKRRIRKMELRYICETDALRQTLLEVYAVVALRDP